jgi:hypothetical protein
MFIAFRVLLAAARIFFAAIYGYGNPCRRHDALRRNQDTRRRRLYTLIRRV